MAKLIINHQDAQKMHQDFYTDDFEVIEARIQARSATK